ITHSSKIKILTITGLFDDPIEAATYPSICNKGIIEDCESYLDKEFPIGSEMVDTLVELCINELVIMFSQNIEDTTNNSQDTPIEHTK
ncbi:MAG: hypothetical protein ACRC0V_11915, partial [Fusobacteriaceae bacterium]|uniref:hypothetical protein n=1 Tax=Romboutsia sp. TaxID=1965302 RepID=UPI003F3B31E0